MLIGMKEKKFSEKEEINIFEGRVGDVISRCVQFHVNSDKYSRNGTCTHSHRGIYSIYSAKVLYIDWKAPNNHNLKTVSFIMQTHKNRDSDVCQIFAFLGYEPLDRFSPKTSIYFQFLAQIPQSKQWVCLMTIALLYCMTAVFILWPLQKRL